MEKSKKIYAVRQGRQVGLYYNWAECEQQIKGYPGAQYKGFSDLNEAHTYLGQADLRSNTSDLLKDEMVAYVDGSYNSTTGEYSAGVVILYQSSKETFSLKDNDALLSKMRNVAGEIMGAKAAMRYAVEKNIANLAIYYDFAGIEKWCTGEWQTKLDGTKGYKEYYSEVAKKINIRFVKVKAHSGDVYNEEADKLAREALLGALNSKNLAVQENQPISGTKLNSTIFIEYEHRTISDKQLLQHFKTIWKKSGGKLNEIKSLEISFDIISSEYRWKVTTVKELKEGIGKVND